MIKRTRTAMDLPIGVLFLLGLLTLWVTASPEITLLQVSRLFGGILLFYLIAHFAKTRERITFLIYALTLITAVLALLSFNRVDWHTSRFLFIPAAIYNNFSLAVDDPIHRNVLAGTLSILLPFPVLLIRLQWAKFTMIQRWGGTMTVILGLATLILTQSRGAVMAFGLAGLFMVLLQYPLPVKKIILIILSGATLLWVIGLEPVFALLGNFIFLGGYESRLAIWARAIFIIQDFPLTGIGMGTYGTITSELYPFFLLPDRAIPHAHNIFLQIAVDLGLLGLISWLAIYLTALTMSWKVWAQAKLMDDNWLLSIGGGLLFSQIVLGLHGLVDAVTWGMVQTAPLVWVIMGIGFAVYRLAKQSPPNTLNS